MHEAMDRSITLVGSFSVELLAVGLRHVRTASEFHIRPNTASHAKDLDKETSPGLGLEREREPSFDCRFFHVCGT